MEIPECQPLQSQRYFAKQGKHRWKIWRRIILSKPRHMQFRFYHKGNISASQQIVVPEDVRHHIVNVLRAKLDQKVICFNGHEEWLCEIIVANKRECIITPSIKLRQEHSQPARKIHLMLSIVKNEALHEAISNATQLEATTIQPIISDRSTSKNVRTDKLQNIAQLSAAQCNRITVPTVQSPITLQNAIEHYQRIGGRIIFASEILARQESENQTSATINHTHKNPGGTTLETIQGISLILKQHSNIGLLIGPEGGFTSKEHNLLKSSGIATPVSLGKNILRSPTAVTTVLHTFIIAHAISEQN